MRLTTLHTWLLLFASLFLSSVVLAQADLSLSISQSTASPSQYTLYSVTTTVTNAGPSTATGVRVDIPTPAGVVYEGGNAFTASKGSFLTFGTNAGRWTVGSLTSGSSATITVNYFLNAANAPDSYAEVSTSNQNDPDSTPGNGNGAVNEDDEASTAGGGGGGPAGQADLQVINLRVPTSTVAAGTDLTYRFNIRNAGTADVPGDFTVKSFLSTDATLSADDIQDGTITTGNFAAGTSVQNILGASNTSALAPGSYYLIVFVDADDVVAESREGNNTRVFPFTVTGGGSTCQVTATVPSAACNNNGTPNNAADDRIDVLISVVNGNTVGPFTVKRGSQTVATGSYGVVLGFDGGLISAASGSTITYSVIDDADPSCSTSFTVNTPSTCSGSTGGNGIDLSLSLSQNVATPARWTLYTVTATVTNDGSQRATGVVVDLPIPDGVVYEGGNEFSASKGSFATFGGNQGQWNVGSIAASQSETISISYFRTGASASDSYAEVLAANQQDTDSTPGNGNGQVNEDDEASTGGGSGGPSCNIQATVASIDCNDNGTPGNAVDDIYSVTLTVTNPTGTFAGFSVSGAPVTYGFRAYETAFTIPLGNINNRPTTTLTFNDLNNASCQGSITITAPQTCSNGNTGGTCDFQAVVTSVVCNDNDTTNDPSDDTYSATVSVTNPAGTFAGFSVSGAPITYSFLAYGTAFTIPLGNITNRPTTTLTFTDLNDASCQGSTTITAPQTCSSGGGNTGSNTDCTFEFPFTPRPNFATTGKSEFEAVFTGSSVILEQKRYPAAPFGADYVQADEFATSTKWTLDDVSGSLTSGPRGSGRATVVKYRNSAINSAVSIITRTGSQSAGYTTSEQAISLPVLNLNNPQIDLVSADVLAVDGPGTTRYLVVGQITDRNSSTFDVFTAVLNNNNVVLSSQIITSLGAGVFISPDDVVSRPGGGYLLALRIGNANLSNVYVLDNDGDLVNPNASTSVTGFRQGYVRGSLQALPNGAYAVAYGSLDPNPLTYVSSNGTLTNLPSNSNGAPLPGATVRSVAYSPSGRIAIAGSAVSAQNGSRFQYVNVYNSNATLTYSFQHVSGGRFSNLEVIGLANNGSAFLLANDALASINQKTLIKINPSGVLECTDSSGGQGVDLELSATSGTNSPAIYDVNSITVTLTNTGTQTATEVSVDIPKPADVVYTGGNEFTASQGSFATFGADQGEWTVGSLAPGATETIVVNYFSLSASGYTQFVEVLAQNETDADSSPGNGSGTSASEDDEAYLDLTSSTTQALTINFYPNPAPAGEQIILKHMSSGDVEVPLIVSDLNGRPVFKTNVQFAEGFNAIPVSMGNLAAGVYIISLADTGLQPTRLVVR